MTRAKARRDAREAVWASAMSDARHAAGWPSPIARYDVERLGHLLYRLMGMAAGCSAAGVDLDLPRMGGLPCDELFMAACFVVAVEALAKGPTP